MAEGSDDVIRGSRVQGIQSSSQGRRGVGPRRSQSKKDEARPAAGKERLPRGSCFRFSSVAVDGSRGVQAAALETQPAKLMLEPMEPHASPQRAEEPRGAQPGGSGQVSQDGDDRRRGDRGEGDSHAESGKPSVRYQRPRWGRKQSAAPTTCGSHCSVARSTAVWGTAVWRCAAGRPAIKSFLHGGQ